MRIKITCDIREGIRLPINYNYFLTGVIYQFLKESDPEYAHFLHQDGYDWRIAFQTVYLLPTDGKTTGNPRRADPLPFAADMVRLLISGAISGKLRRRADGGRNPTD